MGESYVQAANFIFHVHLPSSSFSHQVPALSVVVVLVLTVSVV